jgi:16S rRNA (guanine1516-N2)-methyltransferase
MIGKLAVLLESASDSIAAQQLAQRLNVPLKNRLLGDNLTEPFFLCWREGCLKLLDADSLKKGGLSVDIDTRHGEQKSYPIAKQGALAQAIGRKTKTVVDATAGWGQDSLCLFRMGYQVTCIERSPVMAELLLDGLNRLATQEWLQKLQLAVPRLLTGNAIELLATLTPPSDCIYLDPMFPPKRKKSALAKKSMIILRDLLGDDLDREQLFNAAIQAATKRVVVKSPDYAEPLGSQPSESFVGKLVRYDVYLKGSYV